MNNLHYAKSHRQIYIEKFVKCSILMFLIGVLCGIGIYKVSHKCNIPIFKTVEIKATATPTATPTLVPTVKPTKKPTVQLKATKTPAPTIEVTPEPTQEVAVAEEVKTESNLRCIGTFRISAYCACSKCCGKWANGITASGKTARANHTIAADTSVLPFGTEVYIDGQKYVVEDRGGAIKGKRIDVFYGSHQEAYNHGVKYKEVYIKG